MDLREELARAGKTHDGRVTNGSLSEQMKVIQDWLAHPENYASENPRQQPTVMKTVMTFIREEN